MSIGTRSTAGSLIFALTLMSCASQSPRQGAGQPETGTIPVPVTFTKDVVKRLMKGVFEVVIPKSEDSFVVYDRSLPRDKLPFQERNDKYSGVGTAFAISANRLVSAAHVFGVENFSLRKDRYIRSASGQVYKVKRITRYSQYRDVVEFEVEGDLKTSFLAVNRETDVGDAVYTVGNAFGAGISIRGGQIASFTPEAYDGVWNEIRYSAPASPGNSGGPLLNAKGEVIGVVVKKNGNENLNYALPIAEALKVSTSKTEFYIKGESYEDGGKSVSDDWRLSTALPVSPDQLAKVAQKSKHDFEVALFERFRKKYRDDLFPNEKHSDAYLMEQSFKFFLGKVASDEKKNWGLSFPKYEKTQISQDQQLYVAGNKMGAGTFHYLLVEKPKDMDLADFVANPQLILETVVQSVGWSRPFAGENIRVKSYGKPQESSWSNDELGRPWISSVWRTGFDDYMHSLDCTPMPKGMACVWVYQPNGVETYGLLEILKAERKNRIVSYSERLEFWKEYLALDKKYLPEIFHDAKVTWQAGKSVHVSVGGYEFKYSHANVKDTSELAAKIGYSRDAKSLEVFSLVFVNRFDKSAGVNVSTFLKPVEYSEEKSKSQWQDILSGKSPWNGKAVSSGSSHYVIRKLDQGRATASDKKVDHVDVYGCFEPSDDHDQGVVESCTKDFQVLHVLRR